MLFRNDKASPRDVAVFATVAILLWSLLFLGTFRYPFHWDDYHFIRHYSLTEVLSLFHGWNDPDHIETAAYRPAATLLFAVMGACFGDHLIVLHVFTLLLLWVFLFAVGILLSEGGLTPLHLAVIFTLFVFSRIFASLALWITTGNMVLCYVFMLLASYCAMRYIKRGRAVWFAATSLAAACAVLTREEAYTLPLILPLIAAASGAFRRKRSRRIANTEALLAIIVVSHRTLEKAFVPTVASPRLTAMACRRVWMAVKASWMPGGLSHTTVAGATTAWIWTGFLVLLFLVSVRVSDSLLLRRCFILFVIGVIVCAPAIAVPRSFGIALPSVAFMTATAICAVDTYRHLRGRLPSIVQRRTLLAVFLVGFAIGVGGGIRRGFYVAESMRPDCATRAERDGEMIFDMYPHPVTIPPPRLLAAKARLATYGLRSGSDVAALKEMLERRLPLRDGNRMLPNGLFLPRYDYSSY